jgi:diaminopimelate epimerase
VSTLFYKYQGTGNDFVVLDGRTFLHVPEVDWIQRICHRKWGVGSDGLVIVRPSETNDFHIDFYNPDGSQSFCGNGSRCAVSFYMSFFDRPKDDVTFSAIDGNHSATIVGDEIKISMREVNGADHSPFGCFMNTGSPHVVVPVDELNERNVKLEGAAIRYADYFKQMNGTNVNFIQKMGEGWALRTYERGVEAETLSCGTGVTASALFILEQEKRSGAVVLHTPGGVLEVSAERKGAYQFTDVYLKGSVEKVFEGKWNY